MSFSQYLEKIKCFPISHKNLNLIVAPQQNDFLRARDFIDRQIIPLIIILLNIELLSVCKTFAVATY